MLRTLGKGSLVAVILLLLHLSGGQADARSVLVPMGDMGGKFFTLPTRSVLANTVMAAYQRPYALNFEVWRPQGMPAGWYATFDGFAVAQVAPNRWVYGRTGVDGCIVPTDVLVGSVIPMRVPELTRVTASWMCGDFLRCDEFRKVRALGCDSMGILEDPLACTILAWRSGRPGVWVWLADRWKKVSPVGGQYTWEALRLRRPWILEQLREKEFFWTCGNACDLANLARSWGILWHGPIPLNSLGTYRSGNDGGRGGHSSGSSPTTSPSNPGEENPGSQWDVGGGGGGRAPSDGDGGAGWDTGGK